MGGRLEIPKHGGRARQAQPLPSRASDSPSLKVGDPRDPDPFIGPMPRRDQRQRVRDSIEIARRIRTGTVTI